MPTSDGKLKIALVGCGQIADAHLQEIRRMPGAVSVAVCDQVPELAQQAAARFGVPGVFTDIDGMLAEARPDVVHITTPPHTHRPLALRALAAGAHTYVEKPFTVNVAEADEILEAARSAGRLVCIGHDQLYDPAWQECQELYRRGVLGRVVHVEAMLGYDLSGPFGRLTTTEPGHWVNRLPGWHFQNTISHGLYKVTEFLTDDQPRVWATWFANQGVARCPTELRVFLQGAEVTGTLISTSSVKPGLRVTRVYGTKGSIEVDLEGRVVRRYRAATLRGPFVKLEVPFRQLTEAARSLARNSWRFFRSDLHYFTSMYRLFGRFYQAIREGGEPPIPYAEIRRLTAIMDQIFACCRAEETVRSRALEPVNGLPI
jgi:predicted dehydrogenase